MRHIVIAILMAAGIIAAAKTNTSRPVSASNSLMQAIENESDSAAYADKITLSGYKKTLTDAYESFFVDNQTPFHLSSLTVTFHYTNAETGQVFKECTYEVPCDIPSGQMRQLSVRSFDRQHSFYYSGSRAPRRPATAYTIKYSLEAYDVRISVGKQ